MRHQRLLHKFGESTRRKEVLCAQRLAASKIAAPKRSSVDRRLLCSAQRLAASKIAALVGKMLPHQARARVLNALRHQRLLHSAALVAEYVRRMCSTPCGIKDCCTSPLRWGTRRAGRCSTPCGIKDCCTNNLADGLRLSTKCSTPCGIKDCCTLPQW